MRAVCYKAIEKSSKWATEVEAGGVERRDGKYRCAVNDIVSQGRVRWSATSSNTKLHSGILPFTQQQTGFAHYIFLLYIM